PGGAFGPLEVAAEPVHAFGSARERMVHSTSTTQVSLLPQPCDELTTVEPFRKATRVKPPIVTYVSAPDRMNGRKSRCRGSAWSSTSVAAVESFSIGCAM